LPDERQCLDVGSWLSAGRVAGVLSRACCEGSFRFLPRRSGVVRGHATRCRRIRLRGRRVCVPEKVVAERRAIAQRRQDRGVSRLARSFAIYPARLGSAALAFMIGPKTVAFF